MVFEKVTDNIQGNKIWGEVICVVYSRKESVEIGRPVRKLSNPAFPNSDKCGAVERRWLL